MHRRSRKCMFLACLHCTKCCPTSRRAEEKQFVDDILVSDATPDANTKRVNAWLQLQPVREKWNGGVDVAHVSMATTNYRWWVFGRQRR